jgi:FAD/FMN-containing dehydrogenase
MSRVASEVIDTAQLREGLSGRVIEPGDPEYDDVRRVFVGNIDKRPRVIVRPANANDVARVVAYARETGAELAVRSGGHSGPGHSTSDGGIVLDVRDLRTLDIDVERKTAWAGSGLTGGEYSVAAGAHGLATGFGDTASVGIGGLTLGGGVGYLVRKHGLTIDDLLAAEIVTADGTVRRVDDANEPDLFWAIRGGGGNFGVATRFQFRLHPVGTMVGGMLMLPASPELIQSFVRLSDEAADELTTIANVMVAPPMPFVPPEHHGKIVIMALVAYTGDTPTGQDALAPFRALATPIVDMVRPMAYHEIYPPEDPNYRPIAAGRTLFVDAIDRGAAETILEYLEASNAYLRVAQLRVLGGAMAHVANDATAFGHRQRRIMVNVAALRQPGQDGAEHEAWAERFAAALQRGPVGAYVNFLYDEGQARVRQAYPGKTWDRLVAIKRRYDPTNVFRLNQNIPPKA